MTQTQIYYDDIELDLPDSEVIPITKQVNEIGDLNVFKSDFSQEFRIERTRAMNKLFENAGLIRSESLLPYQALDVKLTSQGMEVLPVAKLSLNRADNEYFYCTVFAGVKPLFQSLSKKLLSGLDLTDLEHTWNTATAVASLIADLDYQYLLFDGSDDGELIGFVSADPDRLEFQTETLRPFVKVSALITKIFEDYNLVNAVALDPLYLKMFLTIDNTKIDGTKAYNLSYETIGTDNFSYNAAIELRTRISDPLGLVVSNTFTAPQSGTYSVVFLFSNQTDATSIDVAIDGLNTASIPQTRREAVGSFLAERGDEITFFYNIQDYINALEEGEEVDPIYPESLYFAVTGFKQSFDFGLPVAVAPFLPEITHGEFLKAICKLFGLVPSYDFLTDQVELWSLSSVLTNKRIAKNWSKYMDYSDTQIDFRLDYAQINRMQYKEDEDVNEGNGDSSIQVNDENLELEKDLFKLPFSFAESVTKTTSGSPVLSDEMARIAWYETIEDSVEYNEKTSIAARLVTREDMTLTTRIGATDLTAAQSKKALGLRLENILPYYEGLTTMLTSTKVLVQKFNLPATEIAALDHSIPVYLDYYNSYFFVKRVRNWIDGELCNVELIRI